MQYDRADLACYFCLVLGLALALPGCVDTWDRGAMTELTPADHGFRYVAYSTSIQYPPEDPAAESTRRRWLDDTMAQSGACPAGWKVAGRHVIKQYETLIGVQVYRVVYDVACA